MQNLVLDIVNRIDRLLDEKYTGPAILSKEELQEAIILAIEANTTCLNFGILCEPLTSEAAKRKMKMMASVPILEALADRPELCKSVKTNAMERGPGNILQTMTREVISVQLVHLGRKPMVVAHIPLAEENNPAGTTPEETWSEEQESTPRSAKE